MDYYDILQVSPSCDPAILESAYRHLAKVYHPDHTGTSDTSKFNSVIEAYRTLRNPDRRAKYDRLYSRSRIERLCTGADAEESEEASAINDARDHARILMTLYKRRREDVLNAGVVGFYLKEMLNCSDEHFEFHKWYLKEKGFLAVTEQGTLAITIEGLDHVISLSQSAKAEKLLIAHLNNAEGPARP